MKNVLIVYYSRTQNTEKAALELARITGADVEKIIDNKNRKGIVGYILGGRDAVSKKSTSIQATKYNASEYELVVLCTPTWASAMTPAIRTYIGKNKEKISKAAFLVTQGGGCNGKVYNDLETTLGMAADNKIDIEGREFKGNQWKEKIKAFSEKLK